jgi:hypothetical protein
LRGKPRARVFENRVLRRMMGPKKGELTERWSNMHGELHNSYSSPNIIHMIWVQHVARMVEMRNSYKILVQKPEGNRPLGRYKRRWEDNIKVDLEAVGWQGVNCVHVAQDKDRWRDLSNMVMNLHVP